MGFALYDCVYDLCLRERVCSLHERDDSKGVEVDVCGDNVRVRVCHNEKTRERERLNETSTEHHSKAFEFD